MIKRIISLTGAMLSVFLCLAQETVERHSKLTPDVSETYNVLKNNFSVMHGLYAAYRGKQLVAAGKYEHGRKVTTWTFFNPKGKILERYNYTEKRLVYEEVQDSTELITYKIDELISDTDRITKPVRIGGRYYGYLRYMNLARLPAQFKNLDNEQNLVAMELLVTPIGRLAEFLIRIQSPYYPEEVLRLNIDLLNDEDKQFIPATYNGKPIPSSIIIQCKFEGADRINFYQ